jgi:regulator of protease activity HflC (stomatin/prohibitin superfamily)
MYAQPSGVGVRRPFSGLVRMEGGPSVIEALISVFGFRIAQEYERGVVFRMGRYKSTKGPGLYWIIPLLDSQRKVDMRTVTVDIEPQDAITRDSVTVQVNAVLYYRIVDPMKAVISVENYLSAVYQAALTTLRNIIGQHDLDELLKSRDTINATLKQIIEGVSEPWGIQVEMVEIKAVDIPANMQRAMAREAEAMREKRARIIKAEAEQEASEKLSLASRQIIENPVALELRRMQMISEVGVEQNTTTIILLPSDFVSLARGLTQFLSERKSEKEE